jgi:hypothetical protein
LRRIRSFCGAGISRPSFDPQTSGGLLIAIAEEAVTEALPLYNATAWW